VRLVILKFLCCVSSDVVADINNLHVKKIHLVGSSYIIIEDKCTEVNPLWYGCGLYTSMLCVYNDIFYAWWQ
jgi:hypothetical protein